MSYDNPKYYRSIPLVAKREKRVQREEAHLVYNAALHSGRIRGTLVTRQPVHVGTGLLVAPQTLGLDDPAPLVKSFHRVGHQVTIPGSSLKGAVRNLVEALTYSAVSKTRARLDRDTYGESRYNSRRGQGELDPAGRIFGAMGYLGHVRFADVPLSTGHTVIHDIPPQYQPKGDDTRRYYPHGLVDERQAQWPLEVAIIGSHFPFTIQFENLADAEIGVILIALGQTDPPICLKLGAGKSSGLGAVRCDAVVVETWDSAAAYNAYDITWQPQPLSPLVEAALALDNLVRKDNALARLQADLGCSHLKDE